MKLKSAAAMLALLVGSHPYSAIVAQPRPEAVPVQPARQSERPHVIIWMLDDVGFAQLSSFGGLIDTPNIDRVATRGVRGRSSCSS
jgi:arylsulfatase